MLIWLFLAGLVVGGILGYVFAFPVLVVVSVLALFVVLFVLKDAAKAIGVLFIGGPTVIGFFLGMWLTQVFVSWPSTFGFLTTTWGSISPYILR